MYQYLGFGLLSLAAILMIPAQDVESISGTSMYGMAILTVHDSTGNTLLTNTVHNIVVDTGTQQMLGCAFEDSLTTVCASDTTQANGICLTDSVGFGVLDTITSTNFATTGGGGAGNSLDGAAGNSCKTVVFTLTATQIAGALTNFAAGGTNVPDGTTITGFATCDLGAGPDLCLTTSPLISAIATSVTLNTGETVDITYTLILD